MTRASPKLKSQKAYVYFGPQTWGLIRRRYLDGESGPALAEAFGCCEATIYRRARLEGWSRHAVARAMDGLAPEPAVTAGAMPSPGVADAGLDPRAAAHRALDQAMRWLLAGQTARAAEAARVAEAMARAVTRLGGGGATESEAEDAAELEAVRRRVLALCGEEADD